MEEKIIEGKLMNIKTIALSIFTILGTCASVINFYIVYSWNLYDCSSWNWNWDWVVEQYGKNANVFTVTLHDVFGLIVLYFAAAAVIAFLYYLKYAKTELIVTNKRVYGKTVFGRRVDLPLDSISAVGTGIMKSIAVTSASGAIKFSLIENKDSVHKAISDLLIERQEKQPVAPVVKQEIAKSDADELKKYKDLLDSGIITQEEFDTKKKQILGL